MRIETFKITKRDLKDGAAEKRPFIKISNIGCDLNHCECSPQYFISVSDGKCGICIELEKKEYDHLFKKPGLRCIYWNKTKTR